MKGLTPALRDALRRDRERYVVPTGPIFGWFPGAVRRAAERALRTLGTDYLDVLQLYWLSKMSALTGAVQEELLRLRAEGKVRAIGVSIHDRPRAGRLAEDSILDLLMIRYNAAHPGAERDVFPHLARRRPAVVAYTATAWRKLLKPPRGWTGPRHDGRRLLPLLLSSPHVDVVLSGPAQRGGAAREPRRGRPRAARRNRARADARLRRRRPRLTSRALAGRRGRVKPGACPTSSTSARRTTPPGRRARGS